MTLEPGTRLGSYELLNQIGAGGMGEVFRARDAKLGREVAIKVLPAATAQDPEAMARFEREAKAVASLSHPNILAIHDFGNEGGTAYAVMELLEGEPLRARLQHGALPPRKALEFASQIAHGLAAAHDKGIVHRDLKPENLFLTRDGRLKILDFGLAKQTAAFTEESKDGQAATPTRSMETAAGTVLGTVGYMAPEQVRGKPTDHRSDLFAFGAVLYEMLSGRRAFKGESAVETLNAILHGEPQEFDSDARGIAPGVMALVRHCLEKEPTARFQSARDLAFDLDTLSSDSGKAATQAGRAAPLARAGRLTAAGVILGLVGLALFTGSYLSPKQAVPPKYTRLSFRAGSVEAARFAPGGLGAVYSALWKGEEKPRLYSVEPGSPEALEISALDAELLAVSSKGELAVRLRTLNTFAWTRRGVLARMPANGGTPRELLEDVHHADWAPDGENLAVTLNQGGKYRLEYPIGKRLYETDGWISSPSISPDGKRVAFVDHPLFGDDRGAIALINAEGKKETLSKVFESVQGLRWDAGGKKLWTAASDDGINRGLLTVDLKGGIQRVITGTVQLSLYDRARDGRMLLGSGSDQRRVYGKLAGDDKEKDYTWLDWTLPAAVSPDGKSYLFTEQGEGGGPGYSVFLGRADGSAPVRLGSGQAFGFSPDGKWALSMTLESRPSKLRLLPVGPGEAREILVEGIRVHSCAFHPAGKELMLRGAEEGKAVRSWRIPLTGGKPTPVTAERTVGLSVSPDGKWLLASNQIDDTWQLIGLDGGAPAAARIPAPPSKTAIAAFTPDSAGFFFRGTDPATRTTLFRVDQATGKSSTLRKLDESGLAGGRFGGPNLSPDGNFYLLTYGDRQLDLYVASGAGGK